MTVDAPVASGQSPAGTLTHRQILVILSGLLLGMFLAALDQTIVGTSIRTIADDLHGLSLQAWATTAYLITSTITTPIYGKLSDIYGRRPLFITAISIFVIGSLACTFSQSMYQLAVFRALQGLGAGGLFSLAFTILADIMPPRERAKYQGYFLAVFGTSSVLGPVIGGFLAGQSSILGITGWRWVFLVNAPIGIIALAVVAKVLHVPHQRHDHRVDYWGALFLTVGLVPLLLVAEQGREWGWDSNRSIICYAIGAIGLISFIFVEHLMKDAALIPLRLFGNSTFSMTTIAGFIVGVGMFGGISMIPQYLQIVQGMSPTKAGLMMVPMTLGIMAASIISGQITSRTGRYKLFPIVGTLLLIAGMLLFHQVGVDTPLWQPLVYMVVFGLGLGNCMQTLTVAAQNSVSFRDMGVATASTTFFRQMGGTVGVAVFLSILFSTLPDRIKEHFQSAAHSPSFVAALQNPSVVGNPANKPVVDALHSGGAGGNVGGVLQDSSFLHHMDPRLARPILQGFTDSIDLVFLAGAVVMVVAFLVTLFIKEIPLRTQTATQAAAAEGVVAAAAEAVQERAPEPAQEYVQEMALMGAKHALAEQNGHQRTAPTAFTEPIGERVHGQVRRGDGGPVAGAVLTLIDHSGRQVSRGTAGDDGTYALNAPGTGAYVLIASAPRHQPQASSLTVHDGPANVDVVLSGSSGVTGVVRAAGSGDVLPGARVTLADERGEVVGSKTTAADGRYYFTELVAGGYTLVVNADGFRPAALPLLMPDTGEVRRDVELVGGAQLTGRARTRDGQPVADARITVVDDGGNVIAMTHTDAEGQYVLTDLTEGEYTVIASSYPPVATQSKITAGERVRHDVELGYEEQV
jgi:EmrB/QacA subfamily drug resistance transporter